MSPLEQRRAKLTTQIAGARHAAPLSAKVSKASKANPTAAAFNIWHANSDVGIGSDLPWGQSKRDRNGDG